MVTKFASHTSTCGDSCLRCLYRELLLPGRVKARNLKRKEKGTGIPDFETILDTGPSCLRSLLRTLLPAVVPSGGCLYRGSSSPFRERPGVEKGRRGEETENFPLFPCMESFSLGQTPWAFFKGLPSLSHHMPDKRARVGGK